MRVIKIRISRIGRRFKSGLEKSEAKLPEMTEKLGETAVQPASPLAVVRERPEEAAARAAPPAEEAAGGEALETKVELIDISDLKGAARPSAVAEELEDLRRVNIKYPLTPFTPEKGADVFAWAQIKWDASKNSLAYTVIEPVLSAEDKENIDRIKKVIEEEIDIDFKAFSKESAVEYLKKNLQSIIDRFSIRITPEKLKVYSYYVLRDFVGLGPLQPILNDENIEDVSCDGMGVPVYIYHKDARFGSLVTNLVFDKPEELNELVMKVAQRCGRSISTSEPLLQGALPDGSRVQATLETDIATRGSNLTIRKFSKHPLTPVQMLSGNTMDAKLLAYVWFAIEHGRSVLIAGATAAGKTSLLNSLSFFIKPSYKIVSIEDTPEIQLPHEHWIAEVSRAGFGEAGEAGRKAGEISMFDLLKGSLRQRPDYIIVGEIRGVEASVLFQQMSTGHPGISTFHADSLEKVIDRLTTRPINLSPSLLETLDILVFIKRLRYKAGYVRRVTDVHEVMKYDKNKGQLITNKVFEWDPATDTFKTLKDSYVMGKLSSETGITQDFIRSELEKRVKVLHWMADKYITNYKRVGEVLKAYYTTQESLMDLVEAT